MENRLRVFESGAALELAKQHVRASCLKWHGEKQSWLVEFEYACTTDRAKLAAALFLETCYFATDVTFWKRTELIEHNRFYALFVMGDIDMQGYQIVT